MPAGNARGFLSRLAKVDWARVYRELDEGGISTLPRLLTAGECRALVRVYEIDRHFRSTIDMERHRFGRGQYRYFSYPLPLLVEELRQLFYERLCPIANEWAERSARGRKFPPKLEEFLRLCRRQGQTRPTPLMLRYGAGDYNRLHQDLYGAAAFPLQVVVNLCSPERDYEGGELILTEQQPRTQSRATVLRPGRGDAVVFTNREHPVSGSRGVYRVQMRHGASTVTRGNRFALGLIFHDAE
jgi:hypothetical protein